MRRRVARTSGRAEELLPARAFLLAEQEEKRKAINAFIRTSGVFDGVVDFDKATLDSATGELKAEFVPESTTGGPGDKLHPNRAGYLAMGQAIELDLFKPGQKSRSAKK